jgi:hypothetical protein
MADDRPTEDITELAEQAKIVAEATGREETDVLADLLDDGILNNSHKEPEKDLVTQLKEAAELITTVQSINQEVSENKVLNGGENSTEVKVETTLEGDIVDRAIASVERKAEKIRKIVIIVAPILLLLTGGMGLEFFLDDDGGGKSDYYEDVWGCTAPDADNFMPDATIDDGSCFWHDNSGGGGGPPPQSCNWEWSDNSYLDDNESETLYVRGSFSSFQCPHEMEGDFRMVIFKDGEFYAEEIDTNLVFYENQDLGHEFNDLEEGDYTIKFRFDTYDGSNWNWDSPNNYWIETFFECDALLQNQQGYLVEDDEEQDAITLSVDIAIPSEIDDSCDNEQFELTWRLYENSQVQYEGHTWEDGSISDQDRADYASYNWDGVNVGTYESRIILKLNDEIIDEKWLSYGITIEPETIYGCTDSEADNYDENATEDDDSCTYPPEEPCEVEIQNHYRGHVADDEEQDAILIAFRLAPTNCEGDNLFVEVDLYQSGYDANYTYDFTIMGDSSTDITQTFDGVAIGNSWTPRITVTLDGEQLEQVLFWGIDVVEQQPETCEINLFDIELITNNTTATIGFDLDCGYDTNDLEGYNVSVQFLVYHLNETNQGANGTGPIEWTTEIYYIEGYADDIRVLTLDNFTVENITHYDFYWYAIWTDANGEQQFLEETWLNRQLEA